MSGSPPKSTGAALVVGGGVAGIQCSLDLAEGGYKVYLVERAPALGGHMAQLDKTFPTNDCSMCTLAPKLVEAGRHLNIEMITTSELIGLEGEPGDFSARIYRHARFVDPDKCTSCGECSPVCPVTVTNDYDEGLSERKAIDKLYAQAIPSTYFVTKKGHSPCKRACAVHTSAQGYLALIADGRYAEAYTSAVNRFTEAIIDQDSPQIREIEDICRQNLEGSVKDPVLREMVKQQVSLNKVQRKQGEGAEEHRLRQIITGRVIEARMREVVENPEYRELPELKTGDESRKLVLERAIAKARAEVNRLVSHPEFKAMDEAGRTKFLRGLVAPD